MRKPTSWKVGNTCYYYSPTGLKKYVITQIIVTETIKPKFGQVRKENGTVEWDCTGVEQDSLKKKIQIKIQDIEDADGGYREIENQNLLFTSPKQFRKSIPNELP